MLSGPFSRFAVIADVHGNCDALAAVLADIETLHITTILNLGDHLSGPLAARETVDLIINRNIISISGNHDRWLSTLQLSDMGPSDHAARTQLEDYHLDWLRNLPATEVLAEGDIFLCHGTPTSDTSYWMERVSSDGTLSLRPLSEINGEAGGLNSSLLLCGHTHIPRAVRLDGGRLLVNPGSVGCPGYDDDNPVYHVIQTGSPHASYAIMERCELGWQVSFRHIPYDSRRMVHLAESGGRQEWARALATGWIA